MDYYLIAYIFLVLITIFQASSTLFRSERSLAGIVVLILFILIFVFYGMRWFHGDRIASAYKGSWPPVINTCPDYLTYYRYKDGATVTDTCIDIIGVARSSSSSGATLTPWSSSDNAENPPSLSGSGKYFTKVYRPGMGPSALSGLCAAARSSGLTWEGVTDGESCTYAKTMTV